MEDLNLQVHNLKMLTMYIMRSKLKSWKLLPPGGVRQDGGNVYKKVTA